MLRPKPAVWAGFQLQTVLAPVRGYSEMIKRRSDLDMTKVRVELEGSMRRLKQLPREGMGDFGDAWLYRRWLERVRALQAVELASDEWVELGLELCEWVDSLRCIDSGETRE